MERVDAMSNFALMVSVFALAFALLVALKSPALAVLWALVAADPVLTVAPVDTVELIKAYSELIKTIFYGVGSLCIPLATVYVMIGAARAKRAEVATVAVASTVADVSVDLGKIKDDVKLLEINTNSMTSTIAALSEKAGIVKGEAKEKATGERVAEALRQGAEQERAAVAAAAPVAAVEAKPGAGKPPLPVADERTAGAAERVASATERVANATEDKK